jgi:hypothetical protein
VAVHDEAYHRGRSSLANTQFINIQGIHSKHPPSTKLAANNAAIILVPSLIIDLIPQ